MKICGESKGEFLFCAGGSRRLFCVGLSGGVMVALGPLEASVMVRIHAGQPSFSSEVFSPSDTDSVQPTGLTSNEIKSLMPGGSGFSQNSQRNFSEIAFTPLAETWR